MNQIIQVLALGCAAAAVHMSPALHAQEKFLFPGRGGQSSVLENMRFTVDLSSRASVNTATGHMSTAQFIGFDVHKVFTGEKGDWGTAVVQGYVTRIDNQKKHPAFFEGEDDWELVYRIFNFNYTALARGRFNIRVGHFEIPYGLEHLVNTNGTLRDYTHGRNIGVKADWGVGVNGEFDAFEYEIGLSRGSGNAYFSTGNPYILAGRVGTPRDKNVVAGFSFMQGDVARPGTAQKVLRRKRFGPDIQVHRGPWSVLAEASYGEDQGNMVVNGLVELDWRSPAESWLIYTQTRFFNQEFASRWDDASSAVVGVRFAPDNHWAFSAQLGQEISTFGASSRGGIGSFQVRYRF